MKSAGETAEGLKDEPIIFQFFPRKVPSRGAQCRGLLAVGSWLATLRPVCSRPLSVTASSTNNDTIFHTPPPMLINGNLDRKSIKFRKDIYYSY